MGSVFDVGRYLYPLLLAVAPDQGGFMDSDLAAVARIGDLRIDPIAAEWNGFSTVVYRVVAGDLSSHLFESQKAVLASDSGTIRAVLCVQLGRLSIDDGMIGLPNHRLHANAALSPVSQTSRHWRGRTVGCKLVMNAEQDSPVIINCKDEGWDSVLYEKLWETGPIRLITLHSSYEGFMRQLGEMNSREFTLYPEENRGEFSRRFRT